MRRFAVFLAVLWMFSGFGFANPVKEEGCKFCKTKLAYEEEKVERLKRELGLTDAQTEKLKHIIREEREAIEKFIKEHKIPLKEALKDGKFKKDVFVATAKENVEKRATIKATYFEKIFELLDENQKKKFLEMIEKDVQQKQERMRESL